MNKYEIALIVILIITVLLVGGKKLPELARGVGEAGRELKKGFKGEDEKTEKKNEDK
ncbi:MAG: twin-arginine translocase TatA/TatE family subunit [Candidatus Saccharimonadaceae bacterium]|nr:twin-arginine translocase TatA/TatE family subunit [Candidatus Saccharimonadaceae bacterium]